MKHTIQALVENKFGVLARIASLFSARGYNIDSLAVAETQDPTVSCITMVVNAEDERVLEQIKKQLNKLIDVIKVVDLTKKEYIDRELLLIKINNTSLTPEKIRELKKDLELEVLEENKDYLIIEFLGDHNQVRHLLSSLKDTEVRELVRTGKIAITK
ncbi:MAG TPA: acetolactate synthase small subunit [Candidatus Omnitrophica bacterium]|nr:MAG: acetolactate synthase small subunit [Candidatus Omnitrophota bacterium]RKY35504.1 MAG: acetolactate synthase small subunit [Candidatus Omnitrophota bacterium]RKY45057.1 MAG: acetolactate synthase small subunit [Candidatus Omnitrophota bacterium]HEC69742.1 acetolactate synthase small subunit [Candidatus Omnitrophota bacterium]